MQRTDRLIFWLCGLLLLSAFVYSISQILLPFVVALITAYFLNPSAAKMEKIGISRTIATAIITCSFFVIVITVAVLVIPVLYDQLRNFLHTIPTYIAYVNNKIIPEFSSLLNSIDPDAVEKAKDSVSGVSGYAITFLGKLVGNLWSSGVAIINLLSLFFITPIVTFYMLKDWKDIVAKVNEWLPPQYAGTIRTQIRLIDRTLSGYIRGQTHVCLILGVFYAVSLTAIGLEFSLFIGLASGFLLFIPYVGALFGFVVGMLVAFFQFGDVQHMSYVAAIFMIGQIMEGTVITPNLVGNKVGLHPVWIMFGLLSGGAMFGFIGVLAAVPVTAVIGVLARFFIGQYVAKIKGNVIADV